MERLSHTWKSMHSKPKFSVTHQPQSEHLPVNTAISVGRTLLVQPTQSKCSPKQIMVGWVIIPSWDDGWIHVKVINSTNHVLTLKRNSKIADNTTCIAVKELPECDQTNWCESWMTLDWEKCIWQHVMYLLHGKRNGSISLRNMGLYF